MNKNNEQKLKSNSIIVLYFRFIASFQFVVGSIGYALVSHVIFIGKICAFLFLYIWIRGTLPRFRFDQLMNFGWKFLLPVALANVIVTILIVYFLNR